MPKIKNIVIFIVIVAILVLGYFFFIKPSSSSDNLISATPVSTDANILAGVGDSSVANDFLTLLLNVKNIKLDDTIFADNAFTSLHDSSITLTADGTEGRPNPFAPLGSDNVVSTTADSSMLNALAESIITPEVPPVSDTSTSASTVTPPTATLPVVSSPAIPPITVKKP